MVVGQQRGRDTRENLRRNFGMPAPEGYRKTSRLARLAARFGLPIVTFVDTKGADPGISSEEHAQSEAIATCLQTFSTARVPIVAAIVGEGGSGGALALAIADHVLMLEHSTYSVASPEGCAAILWSDAGKAEEAAARLKLTADDLHRFGVVDEIIAEPLGGAHRNPQDVVTRTLDSIDIALDAPLRAPPGTIAGGALSKVPPIGRMAGGRRGTRRERRSDAARTTRAPPCRPNDGGGSRGAGDYARCNPVCACDRRESGRRARTIGDSLRYHGARTPSRRTAARVASSSRPARSDSGDSRSAASRPAKRGPHFRFAATGTAAEPSAGP